MRYYIATKLDNWSEHNRLRDLLSYDGHEITYDWTIHGSVWREGPTACEDVSVKECRGVTDADLVIVLLHGGRGTHVELGVALGSSKPVAIIGYDASVTTKSSCAFYHHPQTRCFINIESFMEWTLELRQMTSRRGDYVRLDRRCFSDRNHWIMVGEP